MHKQELKGNNISLKGNKTRATKASKVKQKAQEPVTVLFVPRTPNGGLVKAMKEAEQELRNVCRTHWKIVEEAGTKLIMQLHQSDPWKDRECRHLATVDEGETPVLGTCRDINVSHRNICLKCREEGKIVEYLGEMHKSILESSIEHHNDVRYKPNKSHIL